MKPYIQVKGYLDFWGSKMENKGKKRYNNKQKRRIKWKK